MCTQNTVPPLPGCHLRWRPGRGGRRIAPQKSNWRSNCLPPASSGRGAFSDSATAPNPTIPLPPRIRPPRHDGARTNMCYANRSVHAPIRGQPVAACAPAARYAPPPTSHGNSCCIHGRKCTCTMPSQAGPAGLPWISIWPQSCRDNLSEGTAAAAGEAISSVAGMGRRRSASWRRRHCSAGAGALFARRLGSTWPARELSPVKA